MGCWPTVTETQSQLPHVRRGPFSSLSASPPRPRETHSLLADGEHSHAFATVCAKCVAGQAREGMLTCRASPTACHSHGLLYREHKDLTCSCHIGGLAMERIICVLACQQECEGSQGCLRLPEHALDLGHKERDVDIISVQRPHTCEHGRRAGLQGSGQRYCVGDRRTHRVSCCGCGDSLLHSKTGTTGRDHGENQRCRFGRTGIEQGPVCLNDGQNQTLGRSE